MVVSGAGKCQYPVLDLSRQYPMLLLVLVVQKFAV